MKFSIFALLLALGAGSTCVDSECDATSHLATRTKITKIAKVTQEILISELSPAGALVEMEISGPPGDSFSGCTWGLTFFGTVVAPTPQTGTFDLNGLLVVDAPLGLSPPVIYFLSESCPTPGVINPDTTFVEAGQLYDSIGVPGSQDGENNLENLRSILAGLVPVPVPGTDLPYTGAEMPDLVFRDASVGDLYLVNLINSGPVFDTNNAELDHLDPADFDKNPLVPTLGAINPRYDPSVIGDPHIHTLAGNHYTLLREGSFLLWQFGLEQPKAKWQLYAHYAGRQSFTKGLLLVDTSGPKPSAMEITSKECQWQTKGESNEWSPVTSDTEVLLPNSSSRMKLIGNQHKDRRKVELFLADENSPVAKLKVMCRPGHHINLKLSMNKKKWGQFVSGELKGQKQRKERSKEMKKISMLQLDAKDDQEFQVTETWKELGGSSQAQLYLQNLDENPGKTLALLQTCDPQAEAEARAICRKHLGETSNSDYFKECVFDVCSGAGEVAAEMAAEMLKF